MYRGRHREWLPLYQAASLRLAPGVTMELVPGDAISDSIAFTGIYELALSRHVLECGRSGGTMIDVGANLGYFALLWAASNPRNRCVAFEASPRNRDRLIRNIARNRFDTRIEVVFQAAGAAPGRQRFDVGPEDQTGWGGFVPASIEPALEVDVVRIDDVIGSNDPIALLKVDIEGADAWALMGCKRLLTHRLVREIWYEQNKPRARALGIPLEAAQEFLTSVGYESTPRGSTSAEIVEWTATPR
jgi:FkbM family methyltransferase